jgi:hypothetical protein
MNILQYIADFSDCKSGGVNVIVSTWYEKIRSEHTCREK